jgi:hypothetical protein
MLERFKPNETITERAVPKMASYKTAKLFGREKYKNTFFEYLALRRE